MMTMVISGSDGVTFPDSTNQFSGGAFSFKNRLINGGMVIDQRNAGAAVTATTAFPVDRFVINNGTDGAYSAQQDTSAPVGFTNSVKITTTTADATLATTQRMIIRQMIEGTNSADFGWGTANAKTVTLSFWVRSSLTGTFGGAINNEDNTRSYPFTYSISVADTWEYKTVTIPGDTSGTWLTTTSTGIRVVWSLGCGPDRSGTAGAWNSDNNNTATGAVAPISTLDATWYITGVQLEVGSVATPFERRPYGTELALCQRYFQFMPMTSGASQVTTDTRGYGSHIVEMRVAPTVAATGVLNITDTYSADFTQSSANVSLIANDTRSTFVSMSNFSGLTVGRIYFFPRYTNSNKMSLSAEL